MTSKPPSSDEHESIDAAGTVREFVSMAVVVAMLSLLGYAFIRDQLSMHHAETPLIVDVKTTTPEIEALCGQNTRDGRPTPITFLYSDDKEAWIEDVAHTFAKLCPNIQVKLSSMDDVSSADAIVAGLEKPMLWSPADDLVVRYFDAHWRKERPNDAPLLETTNHPSIAASPLVLLIWHDRAQVMRRIKDARPLKYGPWVEANCAQVPIYPNLESMVINDMVPGTWIDWYNPRTLPPPDPEKEKKNKKEKKIEVEFEDPRSIYRPPFPSVEKLAAWGRVKFVHSSPTRSAAGLEAIYLMAYDYVLPLSERSLDVTKFSKTILSDPAQRGQVVPLEMQRTEFGTKFYRQYDNFLKWMRRCEAGLDPAPKSLRLLTNAFFHVGARRYDAVVTFEHLAFDIVRQVDEYGGAIASMEVHYPSPTIMNQHPIVTLGAEKFSAEEKRAIEKWIAYLRSADVQKKAVDYGFRSINPDVSIREYDSEDNPFLKYRRYGIDFESPILEPPRLDSGSIADLVRLWQDATGRN